MRYCKGCGVEIRPSLKPGRPRSWCFECKPTITKAVRDDHDQLVVLEEAAALNKEDREREERKTSETGFRYWEKTREEDDEWI